MADPSNEGEEVDLAPERRRFVEDLFRELDSLTFYELLGIAPDADRKLVRQAYFRVVTIVHTDRYFGKRLGRYKSMMEAIFARVTLANETLSNPVARAEYDESIASTQSAPTPSAPPVSSPTSAPATPSSRKNAAAPIRNEADLAEERRRKQEAQQRRLEEARARAREHANAGARAQAAGDFERAVASYRLALTLLPNDATLRAAYQAVSRAAAERLTESLVRQATLEERYGHWVEAAATWQKVLDARPDDPLARERLEKAREQAKRGG